MKWKTYQVEKLGEVTLAIKEKTKRKIKKLKRKNIGILITDHNVRETLKIVDRVYIVNEGAIYFEGTPNDAANNEKIKKFYLGSRFTL